jgi:MFS family permease
MKSRRTQYLAIFLTVFIDVLGFGIAIPVLPLYAEHLGASPLQIGLLVGAFSLMQFLFAPGWGRVSDRLGRRRVLLIGMAGTVAGYLVMGFAGSVGMLLLGRVISGVAGANLGAAQAYLADISRPEERARAMGLFGAAFGLGFVFGPALGGLVGGVFGFAAPMFVAAALAAANGLFIALFVPESRQGASETGLQAGRLFAHVRLAPFLWCLVASFTAIGSFSILTTLFALYLNHRFGLGIAATGTIFAGVGLLGAMVQGGLIGRLAPRFGESSLAASGAVFLTCGLAGMALAPSVPPMLAAVAAVGLGNSLLMPSLSSLASRAADPSRQGRALGILQSCGSLARFLGPMACGLLLAAEPGTLSYGTLPLAVAAGIGIVACAVTLALGAVLRTARS